MSTKQQKISQKLMTAKQKTMITVLLGFTFGIAPLSADSLAPILPIITGDLSISIHKAQLIISAYFAGFAFSHLFMGSLTDRFGRKPILITSLIIYVVCSLLCTIIIHIDTILIARVFQGFFAAASVVVGRAIIRDMFEDKEVIKALALMLATFSIMPIITPFIGSFFAEFFHWSWMFGFMAFYGLLIIILISILIPETLSLENRQSLHPVALIANYKIILKSRAFIAYSFGQALFFSGLFINVAVAPFVIINFLKHSPLDFSLYIASVTVGLTLGSFLSRKMINHYSALQTENISLILMVGSGGVVAVLAYLEVWHISALLIPMFAYNFGYGIFQPVAISKTLKDNRQRAGTISALLGAIQFSLASALTYMVSMALGDTTLNMSLFILVLSFIGFVIVKTIAPRDQNI
jgi:MFS transporter, DHA1 family, multidrug resistance protein